MPPFRLLSPLLVPPSIRFKKLSGDSRKGSTNLKTKRIHLLAQFRSYSPKHSRRAGHPSLPSCSPTGRCCLPYKVQPLRLRHRSWYEVLEDLRKCVPPGQFACFRDRSRAGRETAMKESRADSNHEQTPGDCCGQVGGRHPSTRPNLPMHLKASHRMQRRKSYTGSHHPAKPTSTFDLVPSQIANCPPFSIVTLAPSTLAHSTTLMGPTCRRTGPEQFLCMHHSMSRTRAAMNSTTHFAYTIALSRFPPRPQPPSSPWTSFISAMRRHQTTDSKSPISLTRCGRVYDDQRQPY